MTSLPQALRPEPVGKERLAGESLAELQRKRLLDRATRVFAERGYPASTVDDLVAAAQMGVGSFYSLFSGKEAVLLLAYDEIIRGWEEVIGRRAAAAESWAESVLLGLRQLLELIAAEPPKAKLVLIEIQTGGPAAVARYEATLADITNRLRAGRRLAKPDGPDLPQALEKATVRGIAWLLHLRVGLGESASVPALLPEIAELVLGPYVPEPELRALMDL